MPPPRRSASDATVSSLTRRPAPEQKSETDSSILSAPSSSSNIRITRAISSSTASYIFENLKDIRRRRQRRPSRSSSPLNTPPSSPSSPSSCPSINNELPNHPPSPPSSDEINAEAKSEIDSPRPSFSFVPVYDSPFSPKFYPLPSIFKQIPFSARTPFIKRVKPILIDYLFAHNQGDNRRCNQLMHQFLDFPRLYLAIESNRGGRQIDAVKNLSDRLNHHNDRDEPFIDNHDQEEKRIKDDDTRAIKRAVSLVKMGDMKRAIKTLSSNTRIAPIDEKTLSELEKLHPPRSQPLPLYPPSSSPKIIVSRNKLEKIIRRKLNNGASGGPSPFIVHQLLLIMNQ